MKYKSDCYNNKIIYMAYNKLYNLKIQASLYTLFL